MNSPFPEISVAMAVYNAVPYLREAIESILNQTYQNFEFIIVDDGSSDGSREIIQPYADSDARIRLFSQSNQGVAAARNLALAKSRGNYLAVMDADDICLPNRLEVQYQFLEAHPDIAGCGSQWVAINPQGEVVVLDFQPSDPDVVGTLMFAFYAVHHPTAMVRREALAAVGGYDENRRVASDQDLFSRMLLAGFRFANIPRVLFQWRLTPGGLTKGKAKEQTQASHEIRRSAFSAIRYQDPCRAASIARNILMTFPEGTWFDKKLKRLALDLDRSYLLTVLKEDAHPEIYFTTLEYLILECFEGINNGIGPLAEQLEADGLPWFSHQLKVYSGLAKPDFMPTSNQLLIYDNADLLSVLVPYSMVDSDLLQRIENIRACVPDAEIVVFPDSSDRKPASSSVPPGVVLVTFEAIDGMSPWEAALRTASGRYVAYLEPHIRFDRESLLSAFNILVQTDRPIVYVPTDRYPLEALDENGMPISDPTPHPKWTQKTLLGRDRIVLSGFCHHRRLLGQMHIPFVECGDTVPFALALALAHRRELVVTQGRHREYLPPMALENRVLTSFKRRLLTWYFDSAHGALPSEAAWDLIDTSRAQAIAHRLDASWRAGSFCLHWKNQGTVQDFFIKKVHSPLKWGLFREFARRPGGGTNEALKQGRTLDRWLCLAYSATARLLHRLGRIAF